MNTGLKWLALSASLVAVGAGGYWLASQPRADASAQMGTNGSTLEPERQAPISRQELKCGDDEAKNLIMQVIQRNRPNDLLSAATIADRQAVDDDCMKSTGGQPPDAEPGIPNEYSHCRAQTMEARDKELSEALTRGELRYEAKNFRLQDKDATTGSVTCKATVTAIVGSMGMAEQEVAYKIELLEDGGTHIEMAGLH